MVPVHVPGRQLQHEVPGLLLPGWGGWEDPPAPHCLQGYDNHEDYVQQGSANQRPGSEALQAAPRGKATFRF